MRCRITDERVYNPWEEESKIPTGLTREELDDIETDKADTYNDRKWSEDYQQ